MPGKRREFVLLEIRLNAGLGRWSEICELPLLAQLAELSLPRETYADIVEALYRSYVVAAEALGDLPRVLDALKTNVVDKYPSLFRSRGESVRPAVLKVFVLRELLQAQPDPRLCESLMERSAWREWDARLLDSVLEQVGRLSLLSGIEVARQALEAEEYDRAFDLFERVPTSIESLIGLLRSAKECENESRAHRVLMLLDEAPRQVALEVQGRIPSPLPRQPRKQFHRKESSHGLDWAIAF